MSKYRSELRQHGGVPTVFVNGRPFHSLVPFSVAIDELSSARAGGYMVDTTRNWVDEDGIVTEPTEKLIDEVLDKDPDGLIYVMSCAFAPLRWMDENPDDIQQFEPGVFELGVIERRQASFASAKWREIVSKGYEEFSRRLHEKYEGRVVLHLFGAGTCEEWNPWGVPDNEGRWWVEDFSPAMHAHFRAWLRKKYNDDVDSLRRAWSDSEVTFETARVPGREARLQSDWYTFRHPLKRHVADFNHAYADAIADNIIAFSKAIKRGTNGECLAGSHSGAFLDNGINACLYVQLAANTMRRVVRSDAVDVFTSPISFVNRCPGGSASPMVPTGSLRLHKKLYFHDEDSQTFLKNPRLLQGNVFWSVFGIPETEEQSCAVMKRNIGRDMLGGWGMWWHDCLGPNYEHEGLQACAKRLTEIGRIAVNLERGLKPDMAVLADEQTPFSQQCANRLLYPLLFAQRVGEFSHAGISWDAYEMADFFETEFPMSRLILMLNPFELAPKQIESIRKKLAGSGATVVWFVAPGIQSPDGFDFDAVERLTGFRVKAFDGECNPRISLTNYDHPITQGLGEIAKPHSLGTGVLGQDEREGIFGPCFYIDDEQATILGTLDVLYRPGLAVKEMDGWTSVYSCAPRISKQVIRNLARTAGLHSYIDTEDMICVAPEMILVHGTGAGKRTIHLPEPADVVDLWTDETLAQSVKDIDIEMDEVDTKILFYGDKARLDEARRLAGKA